MFEFILKKGASPKEKSFFIFFLQQAQTADFRATS